MLGEAKPLCSSWKTSAGLLRCAQDDSAPRLSSSAGYGEAAALWSPARNRLRSIFLVLVFPPTRGLSVTV